MKTPLSVVLSLAAALWLPLFSVGCAQHIGTTAKSFMGKVRESTDPNIRYLAYQKLGSVNCYDDESQKGEAARLLAERFKAGTEPTAARAAICRTLGELRRPEGAETLLAAVNDEDPLIRSEACRALGKLGRTEDAPTLSRIMAADTSGDCRIAAIEGLGELRSNDSRIQLMLVEAMEHEDPAIRVAALRSLRTLSGKDLGVEPKAWRDDLEAQFAASEAAPTRR